MFFPFSATVWNPCAEISKATNALHSDQISAAQAGVAKSVVGCDPRTEEGRLLPTRAHPEGNLCRALPRSVLPHILHYGDSRYHRVTTIHHVSASAWPAHSVFAAEEPDTNSLTDFPSGRSAAQAFNAANNFMLRNARQLQIWVRACDRGCIGVTNSVVFQPNPNLSRSWLSD
jgi:hypothetical protein